jgi:galactokinase
MSKKISRRVRLQFIEEFQEEPLTVFSPGRINLIGEHTDYNDGFAFPAAINKGISVAIAKSENKTSTVIALDKNESYSFSFEGIQPLKKGGWRNYILGVISEMHKKGYSFGNFKLAFSGNVPGGAGMSSSAALENAIGFAINELFELGISKEELIYISQKAEHNFAGVMCGIMDQFASMFGEKKSALLLDCRSITAEAFPFDLKEYKIILINSNVKHDLSETAYNDRRSVCERVAKMLTVEALRDATETDLARLKDKLNEEDYQKALYVIQENKRVHAFMKAAENSDVVTLGKLLFQSHEGLSKQYQVSCEELDFLVDYAKKSLAVIGARMMGGGFGGCTINFVRKDKLEEFKTAVANEFKARFKRNCSMYKVKLSEGTRIINL